MKVKIKKAQLEMIVREEIEAVLSELNPYHDKHTGKLSGPNSGNSYSLSEPAVANVTSFCISMSLPLTNKPLVN